MEYSGIVHVFDFDDTLMWAPRWFDDATLDEDGFVTDPGSSPAMRAAMDLFDRGPRGFRLKYTEKPQANGRDVYFQILDSDGNKIRMAELSRIYSEESLRVASISGGSRYSDFASLTDDNDYYRDLNTVGNLGVREDIMNLYKEHASEAVILTARKKIPGMKERIGELLEEHATRPKEIYLKPLTERSASYKGRVILDIAMQDDVDSVIFYDDNLDYLEGVRKVINEYDRKNRTNIINKVELHHADPKDKPNFKLKIASDAVEIANRLDKKGMFKEAMIVEQLVKNLVRDVGN